MQPDRIHIRYRFPPEFLPNEIIDADHAAVDDRSDLERLFRHFPMHHLIPDVERNADHIIGAVRLERIDMGRDELFPNVVKYRNETVAGL